MNFGGEKQRVVFRRFAGCSSYCLMNRFSHLDINFQIEIMDLFYRLNSNGENSNRRFHDINLAANYTKSAVFCRAGSLHGENVITRENIKAFLKAK